MRKLSFLWLCCLLYLVGGTSVFAQNSPEEDDFLQLLRQELQLQYDSLQQTDYPPYFMAYRVNEITEHHLSANFGSIYDNSNEKKVFLTIEMRVGNLETDNYHYLTYKTPYIKPIPLPLDKNASLIRKILRYETRKAYQEAVIQNIENSVAAMFLEGEDDVEKFLFMHNDMDGYYEPPMMESNWNPEDWEWRLYYSTAGNILWLTSKSATLCYKSSRNYLVNSEKSYFVDNKSSAWLTLRLEGLSQDNVLEHVERQYFAFQPDQLPDADALHDEMKEMEMKLSNVLFAVSPGSFQCPVLFSPEAASVLMHNLLGHELENRENSIFRDKIGQQVLPEFFIVYSDPTVSNADGHYYGGHYVFDDEGIIGQRVTHIANGEFQKMLTSRTQQPNAYHLTGHARGNSQLPIPRQSNLFVESYKALEDSQLMKLLSEEVSQQKLDYALYVKEVEVCCDTNDMVTIYPIFCYKIYPKNQKEEQVKDVMLVGGKQQWLNNLIAAGTVKGDVTMICHSQDEDLPTCCVSPALLFRSVEVRQQLKTPQPKFARQLPGSGSNIMTTEENFLSSAQHQWELDVENLKIGNETAPYYEDFLMTEARIYTVEASEGAVFYANEKPIRRFAPKILLGSDLFNSECLTKNVSLPTIYPLPFENRYTFGRDFHNAANIEYSKALQQWKTKQAMFPKVETRTSPERSPAPSTQTYDEYTFQFPTLNNLEFLAQEYSSVFPKNDFLSCSGFNIYIMLGNAYFWSSEKTTYSRPITVIGVQLYGGVEQNGHELIDVQTLFLPCVDSLFSSQVIQNEIDKLIAHLRNVKYSGETENHYFAGPVLIEGEAVAQFLSSALLEQNPNLLAYNEPLLAQQSKKPSFEGQLDKIITSKKITITANKSGDQFDKSAFVRHEKTDAEGVETQETEIIRNGELIALMGNRNITKSTPYSNGFQQLAIHNESCFGTRGATRIDFTHKASVSHKKLKHLLIKEAKSQGCQYAYIIRQAYDDNMCNILDCKSSFYTPLLQCYRVDVRTGEEIPVIGAKMSNPNFNLLQNILYVSDKQEAFPVMMQVPGSTSTRDFPFAGVPTCIVAPEGILLKQVMMAEN